MSFKGPFVSFSKRIQLAHTFGFTRLKWDRAGNCLAIPVGFRRRVWENVQIVLLMFYIFFLLYQCFQQQFSGCKDPETETYSGARRKATTLYVTAVWILLLANHYISIWRGEEFVRLVNGMQIFLQS